MSDSIEALVDRLGYLKAEQSELNGKIKDVQEKLIRMGVERAEGQLFRVAIFTTVRKVLDMDAVRRKLTPQFLRAHTSETEYTTVKVSARKEKAA